MGGVGPLEYLTKISILEEGTWFVYLSYYIRLPIPNKILKYQPKMQCDAKEVYDTGKTASGCEHSKFDVSLHDRENITTVIIGYCDYIGTLGHSKKIVIGRQLSQADSLYTQ